MKANTANQAMDIDCAAGPGERPGDIAVCQNGLRQMPGAAIGLFQGGGLANCAAGRQVFTANPANRGRMLNVAIEAGLCGRVSTATGSE